MKKNYEDMTDEELLSLAESGDDEARWRYQWRQTSSVYPGEKKCGLYTADIDYYGTPEVSNR